MPVFVVPAIPTVVKVVAVGYGTYFGLKTLWNLFFAEDAGPRPIEERIGLVVSTVARRAHPLSITFTVAEQVAFAIADANAEPPTTIEGVNRRQSVTMPRVWQRDP